MEREDSLVAALRALCEREGGYKSVADAARVSADNLSQILSGTKLPSGNPRGVGPGLRERLTTTYPDWLSNQSANASAASGAPTVGQALSVLSGALAALSEAERDAISPKLASLALAPDSQALRSSIEAHFRPKIPMETAAFAGRPPVTRPPPASKKREKKEHL